MVPGGVDVAVDAAFLFLLRLALRFILVWGGDVVVTLTLASVLVLALGDA